ncbi:MAG: FapA family protein, partial [Symbiobacteriaceae bacterium]|nr:FapA family protein [Symbiobacteriaceae bacterium]
AVTLLESIQGSIFVKGGISGNSKAQVKAAHDIFTKFVLDSNLECGGKINIGFFSRNSYLKADELVVESSRGRIQGGRADIGILVTANELGSEMEARTEIYLVGFKRYQLEKRLEEVNAEREEQRKQLELNRGNLSLIGNRRDIDPSTRGKLSNAIRERMVQTQLRMKVIDNELKNLQRYLRLPNEGEIRIRRINPNCFLSHNGLGYEIRERQFGKRYYAENGALHDKQM